MYFLLLPFFSARWFPFKVSQLDSSSSSTIVVYGLATILLHIYQLARKVRRRRGFLWLKIAFKRRRQTGRLPSTTVYFAVELTQSRRGIKKTEMHGLFVRRWYYCFKNPSPCPPTNTYAIFFPTTNSVSQAVFFLAV